MHCSRNPERLARNEHTTQKQIQNIYAHARLLGHGLEVQLAPSAHAKWWIHTDSYYDNRWQVSQVLDAQAVSNARHGSYPLPCAPNLDAEVVPSSRDYPSPLIPQGVLSPGLLVQLSGGSGERPSSARLLTQSCRVMFRKSGLLYKPFTPSERCRVADGNSRKWSSGATQNNACRRFVVLRLGLGL